MKESCKFCKRSAARSFATQLLFRLHTRSISLHLLLDHGFPIFNIWDSISFIYTVCAEDIMTTRSRTPSLQIPNSHQGPLRLPCLSHECSSDEYGGCWMDRGDRKFPSQYRFRDNLCRTGRESTDG